MKGVEILNKEAIYSVPDYMGIVLAVSIGMLLVMLFIGLWNAFDGKVRETIICSIFAAISVIGIIISTFSYRKTDRYTYEAIIDDNVSINEVYEHYNVIEKDGKKWILEDKECD